MAELAINAPAQPAVGSAIAAIGLNTFREAIRDRIFYLLLAFALILIVVARALSLLTVGDEAKIITDIGLSSISIFGVMTAGFVGVSLVFKEIERRTVFTLLANPIRRWHFLVGKFVGLLAVLAVNVVAMSLTLFLVLVLHGASPLGLIPAIVMIYLELVIITAFALLFSSLTNPILSAIWTIAIYVAGHLSWSLRLLQERVNEAGRLLCEIVYWLLPNLSRLDLKREAVHALPVDTVGIGWGVVYGLAYASIVLLAACWVFERKDFN